MSETGLFLLLSLIGALLARQENLFWSVEALNRLRAYKADTGCGLSMPNLTIP